MSIKTAKLKNIKKKQLSFYKLFAYSERINGNLDEKKNANFKIIITDSVHTITTNTVEFTVTSHNYILSAHIIIIS